MSKTTVDLTVLETETAIELPAREAMVLDITFAQVNTAVILNASAQACQLTVASCNNAQIL